MSLADDYDLDGLTIHETPGTQLLLIHGPDAEDDCPRCNPEEGE